MSPRCCGEVILNTAMGKDFYYCRECKKEVSPENTLLDDLGMKVGIDWAEKAAGLTYPLPSISRFHPWDVNTDSCVTCGVTGVDLMYGGASFICAGSSSKQQLTKGIP